MAVTLTYENSVIATAAGVDKFCVKLNDLSWHVSVPLTGGGYVWAEVGGLRGAVGAAGQAGSGGGGGGSAVAIGSPDVLPASAGLELADMSTGKTYVSVAKTGGGFAWVEESGAKDASWTTITAANYALLSPPGGIPGVVYVIVG